jgi:broad specificity phosphatase PhoE
MIYFIRHGETDLNAKNILQGPQTYSPLNDRGVAAARAARDKLASCKFDYIFSSDLLRAKQTAEIINEKHNLKIIFDPRLREYDVGTFAGKSRNEITDAEWQNFRNNATQYGAEPESSIAHRCAKFLKDISAQNIQNALVVTHGGVIRHFIALAQNTPPRTIDYCTPLALTFDYDVV